MNWQKIHQVIDLLTKQKSVPNLDETALYNLGTFLSGLDYRIYFNGKMGTSGSLSLIDVRGVLKASVKEKKLLHELASNLNCYQSHLDDGHQQYFFINYNQRCICLIAIDQPSGSINQVTAELLKMVCQIWQNQLALLYRFQRDPLTNLFNQTIFIEAVNSNNFDICDIKEQKLLSNVALERREDKDNQKFCLALIDIDNFRSINQDFSHSIGDETLKKVARIMEQSWHSSDLLCRYRDDQFAVVIRNIESASSQAVFERFQQLLAASFFPKIDKVTVTIGFTMSAEGVLASELIERAKLALNEGKKRGKNTIINACDLDINAINDDSLLDLSTIPLS